ncbi:MAG: hypothetical protein ACI9DQ_000483 [Glaciecola sp.]|jgi:hypothetical protein
MGRYVRLLLRLLLYESGVTLDNVYFPINT